MFKGQHFWLRKAEECFDKLLNHRPLLHVEYLRALAQRLKNAISTVITHSESKLKIVSCQSPRRSAVKSAQLLVDDALDVSINVSSIPSLKHRLRFVFRLVVHMIISSRCWHAATACCWNWWSWWTRWVIMIVGVIRNENIRSIRCCSCCGVRHGGWFIGNRWPEDVDPGHT